MPKLALIALPAGSLRGAIRRAIAKPGHAVIGRLETGWQMRRPAELNDHLLRDIGLTDFDRHASMLTPHHHSQTKEES